MKGQIIAWKRLVSALLLQYQRLFLQYQLFYGENTITLEKKVQKGFGCKNYLKIERKKAFLQY